VTIREILTAGAWLAGGGLLGFLLIALTSVKLANQPQIAMATCILCASMVAGGIWLIGTGVAKWRQNKGDKQ
jgi:hypothetical protein